MSSYAPMIDALKAYVAEMPVLPPTPEAKVPIEQVASENRAERMLAPLRLAAHLDQQKQLLAGADQTTGAPAGLRWNVGKKLTPQGQLGYLQERLGADNVFPLLDDRGQIQNNAFLFREGPKDQWKVYDPSFWKSPIKDLPGDIADASGELVEGGAMTAGSLGGAALAGPAGAIGGGIGGAILGNIERQAESAALPGEENISPQERVQRATVAGEMAPVAELGGRVVAAGGKAAVNAARKYLGPAVNAVGDVIKGADVPSPTYATAQKIFAEQLPKGEAESMRPGAGATVAEKLQQSEPFVQRLSEGSGGGTVNLSVGQLAGSPRALGFEDLIRNSADTMGRARELDLVRAGQLAKFADNTIGAVQKVGEGNPQIGAVDAVNRASNAYEMYLGDLMKQRSKQAASDFGQVALAAKGQKVFPLTNTIKALDELEAQQSGVGPQASQATSSYLASLRQRLVDAAGESWAKLRGGAPALNPQEFQKTLELWGKAAQVGDSAADKLSTPETKRIAGQVFGALQRDLDVAAEGTTPEVGASLQRARDNYRAASQLIEESDSVFLDKTAKLLDQNRASLAPGELLKRTPEELGKMFDVLRRTPQGTDATDKLVGASLRQIIDQSATAGEQGLGGPAAVSPAKLASGLMRYRKQIEAMLPPGDAARQMVDDLSQFAQKLARTDVFGGRSRTEPMGQFGKDVAEGLAKNGTAWQAVMTAADTVARKVRLLETPEALFQALNNPEQRPLLIKLVGTRPYDRPISEASRTGAASVGAAVAESYQRSLVTMDNLATQLLTMQGRNPDERRQ